MTNIVHLYTYIYEDPQFSCIFAYDLDIPAAEVIKQVAINCNLPNTQQYALFVNVAMGNQSYLVGEETLRMKGVQNGSEIIIMNANADFGLQTNQPLQYMPEQQYDMNYAPIDYSLNSTFTLNSTLNPFGQQPQFNFDTSGQLMPPPTAFNYDDVSMFQTGVQFNYNNYQEQAQVDPEYINMNSSYNDGNYNTSNDGVFNENMAFKIKDVEIYLGNNPDNVIATYDVAIDDNITDETNRDDFGALLFGQKDQIRQMESQGLTPFNVTVHDMASDKAKVLETKLFQTFDYSEVKLLLLSILDLPSDVRYSFMFVSSADDKFWLKEGSSLERFQFTEKTDVYVYHRDLKMKIFTTHFQPRLCTVDAEQECHDVVRTLAENFGIMNFQCYTLFSQKGAEEVPLDPHKPVPEQVTDLSKLTLKRNYFVLSRIDIASLTAASQTYKDCKVRLFKDEVKIPKDMELEFACLQFLCESDKKTRKNPKFPKNVDFLFPENCNNGKGLGEELTQYVKKYDNINQFNAFRRFFKLLKKIPGFASYKYDCTVIARTKIGGYALECEIEIAPHCIRIYNENVLEDKISYTRVIETQFADDVLSVTFHARRGLVAKYDFQSTEGKEMLLLVRRHIEIMRDIMYQRARNTALLPPIINEKFKINLYTTNDINLADVQKSFQYDRNYNGLILTAVAEDNLKMKHSDNHICLLRLDQDIHRFIMKEDILILQGVQDWMTIYVIDRFVPINITFSDGRVEKIKLDLTKTVEQLTKDCFAAIKFPPLTGYTLWSRNNNGDLAPLDVRFTVPEQTPFYTNLSLLRRFYTLSAEILQTIDVARMTMIDTIPCIKESQVQMTDDELNELLALWGYAMVVENFEDSERMTDFTWLQQVFPEERKLNKEFERKFSNYFRNFPPRDKMTAMRNYLGKIRKLIGFGYEHFNCQFQDISRGSVPKVHKHYQFILAPLMFSVGPKEGYPRFQIGYRYIISFETTAEFLIIKFVSDDHGTVSTIKMLFKGIIDEVVMILAYNIKLINDLIAARELKKRKAMEEQVKRLRGGYVDSSGRIFGPMVDFYITKDPNYVNPKDIFWIETTLTGAQAVAAIARSFKLDLEAEYCLLYKSPENVYIWIAANQKLSAINPARLSTLIILEHYPTITVYPIGAKNPAPQQIKIDASLSLQAMMPDICARFDLPILPGITLAYINMNQLVYLDTSRSIPEQADLRKDFYIMLRHFAIDPEDILDPSTLWFLFCQTRECVLRGTYPVSDKDVVSLCYYQIAAFTNQTPVPAMIPQNENEWVPRGMTRPPVGSIFNELQVQNGRIDSPEAMRRYIKHAKNCAGFSVHVFKVEVDPQLDFNSRKEINWLYIGPEDIKIFNENQSQMLYKIPYSNLLSTDAKMEEFAIKMRTLPDGNVHNYFGLIKDAVHVNYLMQEVKEINNQCILNHAAVVRQNNTYMNQENMVNMTVVRAMEAPRTGVVIPMSLYSTVPEVIQQACSVLGLNDGGEYLGLIRMANGEFKWMDPKDVLGSYYPVPNYEIYIWNKFALVPITLEQTYKHTVMIEIDKPLYQAMPTIAAYFYIEFWNGYTLFKDWSQCEITNDTPKKYANTFQPLDMTRSIPEQLGDVRFLVLKRRFYNFTNGDMKSVDRRAFIDVRKHILKSDVKCTESRALELAVYSIFADAQTPEIAKAAQVKNAEKLFPPTVEIHSKISEMIQNTLKGSPDIQPPAAARKYVALARSLPFFGCTKFQVIYEKDNSKQTIYLSIGPFGIHLFSTSGGADIQKISWQNVIGSTTIASKVNIKCVRSDGVNDDLKFHSEEASEICSIVNQYLAAMYPWSMVRDQVQSLSEDPTISFLVQSIKEFSIPLRTSTYVRNPAARPFGFNPNWSESEATRVSLYNLGVKNDRPHCLLYLDSNLNYKWLEPGKMVTSLNPTKLASIYALPVEFEAIVVPPYGPTKRVNLKTKVMIKENVTLANKDFELGSNFGMTLCEFSGNDVLPLDFLNALPTETPFFYAVALRRRFFIVTKDMMTQEHTPNALFRDFSNQVIYMNNIVPTPAAIELGICQLLASCNDENTFKAYKQAINIDIVKKIMPENIPLTDQIYEQFVNALHQHQYLSVNDAIYRYVCIASAIPFLASENYEAVYRDNNPNAPNTMNVLVNLSPAGVQIYDAADYRMIKMIPYSNIISYKLSKGACNVKYQDENFLYQDIDFLTDTRAPQINSYINDIIDCYRYILENNLEILYDENIDYAALGIFGGQAEKAANQMDAVTKNTADDEYIGLINFNDIKDVDVEFGEDDQRKSNFDDAFFNIPTDLNIDKIEVINNEEAQNLFQEKTNLWRADLSALDASRRKADLQDVQKALLNVQDKMNQIDMTDLAQVVAGIKSELDILKLDDSQGAKDLSAAMDGLANTTRNAALSAVSYDEVQPQIESNLAKLLAGCASGIAESDDLIKKIKENEKRMPSAADPTHQLLAKNLVNMSELEEQLARMFKENPEVYEKLGADPDKLKNDMLNNSKALTDLAKALKLNANDYPAIVKLIPELKDCIQQLDNIAKLNEIADAAGIDLSDMKAIETKLRNLAENAEKVALAAKMQADAKNPDLAKQKKFQVYLGNHEPVKAVINDLQQMKPMLESIKELQGIPAAEKDYTNKYMGIVKPSLDDLIDSMKKGVSALYQCPTNEAVRAALLNDLYKAKDLTKDFQKNMGPYTGKSGDVKKANEHSTKIQPDIDNALKAISATNVNSTSLDDVLNALNDYTNSVENAPANDMKKASAGQVKDVKEDIKKLKGIANNLSALSKALAADPTNGELVAQSHKQLADLLKDGPAVKEHGIKLGTVTGNRPIYNAAQRLGEAMNKVAAENRAMEEPEVAKHVVLFQQAQVELDRLANHLAMLDASPQLARDPKAKALVQDTRKAILENRPQLGRCRNELHKHPYHVPTLDMSYDSLMTSRVPVEKLIDAINQLKAAVPNDSAIPQSFVTDQIIGAALEALKNANLGEFRKPPNKEAVAEIIKNVGDVIGMLKNLSANPELKKKPKIDAVLKKKSDEFAAALEKLQTLASDPTVEYIPIAEDLRNKIQETKNACAGLQAFKQDPAKTALVDLTASNLDFSLQKTPPNVDLAKKCILENVQPLEDLKGVCEALKARPSVQNDPAATMMLNDWCAQIEKALFGIDNIDKNPNPSLEDLNNMKNELALINNMMNSIPQEIRPHLNNKGFSDLGKAICAVKNHSGIAANCVRLLPINEKFEFDPSLFVTIDPTGDPIEALKKVAAMIKAYNGILNQAEARSDICTSSEAAGLIKDSKQMLSGSTANLEQYKDDQSAINTLSGFKEHNQQVMNNANALIGHLNNEKFRDVTKLLTDGITRAHAMMTRPHITKANADQVTSLLIDLLQKAAPTVQESLQNPSISSNKELNAKLAAYNKNIPFLIDNLKKMPTEQQQQAVDSLHLNTADLLKLLQDVPDVMALIDKLEPIYTATKKYTAGERIPVKVAGKLIPNMSTKENEKIGDGYKAAYNNVDKNKAKADDIKTIEGGLNTVKNAKKGMPNHLIAAWKMILPLVGSGDPVNCSDAARVLATAASNPATRTQQLTDLAIKDTVRASAMVGPIKSALDQVTKAINKNAGDVPENAMAYYADALKNLRLLNDPAVLAALNSLPACIKEYQPLHMVDDSITGLINAAKDSKGLKPSIAKLEQAQKDFIPWLKQTDLAMAGLVELNGDTIAKNAEEIIHADELGKLPEAISDNVNNIVDLLKGKDRGTAFNEGAAHELSNLLKEFEKEYNPEINKNVPDCQQKTAINDSLAALNGLNPVMRLWGNKLESTKPELVRKEAECDLLSAINDLLMASVPNTPVQAAQLAVASSDAKIQALKDKLAEVSATNKPVAKAINHINKAHKDLVKQRRAKNLDLNPSKTALDDALKALQEFAKSVVPADQSKGGKVDEKNVDKDALKTANAAKQMADALEAAIDEDPDFNENDLDEDDPTSAKKKRRPRRNRRRRRRGGKLRGTLKPEIKARKALQDKKLKELVSLTDPKPFPTDIKELLKQLEQNIDKSDQLVPNIPNEVFQGPQFAQQTMRDSLRHQAKYNLVARCASLQKEQRTVFKDVQDLDNPDIKDLKDFNSNDIQDAMISLQHQFDQMNDPDKLREAQANLSASQFQLQQKILAQAQDLALQPEARLPITPTLDSIKDAEDDLVENLMVAYGNNPTKVDLIQSPELQRLINRGISLTSDINKLQALTNQLLQNNPDAFSYAKTSDGMKVMDHPLLPHDIMETQDAIAKQMNYLNSPEMLALQQKAMPTEKVIQEVRLLSNMLDLLTGKNGDSIICDQDIEANEDAILEKISADQLRISQEDPSKLKLPALVNTHKSLKADHYLLDTLARLDLAQRLGFLQQQQCSISDAPAGVMNPDEASIQPAAVVHRELPSILDQLDALNEPQKLANLIKSLPSTNIAAQQQILLQLASILASPKLLENYGPNAKVLKVAARKAMNRLQEALMKRQIELLNAEPNKVGEIDADVNTSSIEALQRTGYGSEVATKAGSLASLLTKLQANSKASEKIGDPAKKNINKACEGKKMSDVKDMYEELNHLNEVSPEDVPDYVGELNKEEQALAYHIAADRLKALKATPRGEMKVSDMSMAAKVFDRAALIQRNNFEAKEIGAPEIGKLQPKIDSSKLDVAKRNVADQLVALQRLRVAAAPNIITAAKLDEDLLKGVNGDTIGKSLDSIANQFNLTTSPEKLKNEISKSSPQEVVVQQALVDDAIRLATNDAFMDPIVAKLNATGLDPTSKETASKIVKEILDKQAQAFKGDPAAVKKIELFTPAELTEINADTKEQKERSKLNHQFLQAIDTISALSPEAVKISKAKASGAPIKTDVNDLSKLQDLMKSIVVEPAKMKPKISALPADDVSNLIALLSDMAKTVTPLTTAEREKYKELTGLGIDPTIVKADIQAKVSDSKSKKGSKQSSSTKANPEAKKIAAKPISIFKQPIKPDKTATKGVKAAPATAPTLSEALEMLVQAASGVVDMVPKMAAIPLKEAKETLIKDTNLALDICGDMIESNEKPYNSQAPILVEMLPELVGAMTRVVPSLPKSLKEVVPQDPSVIIPIVSNLMKAAIDLNNPKNMEAMKKAASELMEMLKKVNAAVDNAIADPMVCGANILQAGKKQDFPEVHKGLIDFQTAKVNSLKNGSNAKQVKLLDPIMTTMMPVVRNNVAKEKGNNKQSDSGFADLIKALEKAIGKDPDDPFQQINAITKVSDVSPFLANVKPQLSLASDSLINSIAKSERKGTSNAIEDLIKQTADAQASLLKGIDLKNTGNLPDAIKYFDGIKSSMKSLDSVIDSTKKASATPVSLRRAQRTLERVFDQLNEKLQESSKNPDKSQFDQAKIDFMKASAAALQPAVTALSARCSTPAADVFRNKVSSQLPAFNKKLTALKSAGAIVGKAVPDKQATVELDHLLDDLINSLNGFVDKVQDTKNVPLLDAAGNLVNVSDQVIDAVGFVANLSDKSSDKPDIANSEKLPSRFILPTLPADIKINSVSDLYSDIAALTTEYNNLEKEFLQASTQSKTSNSELVDKMLNLHEKVRVLSLRNLSMSASTNNINNQNDMAKELNNLVTAYNKVLQKLRAKFLCSAKDWNTKAPPMVDTITASTEMLKSIAKKIADEEAKNEQFLKVFGVQFANALGPLSAAHSAVSSDADVAKTLSGPQKEWGAAMCDIGKKMGDSVMKAFNYLKDHPNKKLKPDLISGFANQLTKKLNQIDERAKDIFAKSDNPAAHCAEAMKGFPKLGSSFNECVAGIDIPGLKDAISSLCKAAEKLQQNAEAANKNKGAAVTVKAGLEQLDEEDLMKRLILEAKVIKARIFLTRFEAQLNKV